MSAADQERAKALLRRCIGSVGQLDVLLLLRQDRSSFTVDETASRLRTSHMAAELGLMALAECGLLAVDAGPPTTFRYAPNPGDDADAAALEALYRTHRSTVIRLISSRPSSSASLLADAFRLRKDEEDG